MKWLEKQTEGIYLREIIRKLNKCTACYCIICSKELAYGSRGFVALMDHVKSAKHKPFLQTQKEHFALPGSGDKKENGETLYGLLPAYAGSNPVVQENLPQPLTSLSDRTVNLEAMLLRFLAEISLSFAVAPDLLELVKEMSKDRKALNRITVHRNAASYKTRFGTSKQVKETLFEDLQKEFFSLNLDESTNSSNRKNTQNEAACCTNVTDAQK
ncbi:hypothetical protein AVEN_126363-1 [Araneus ventricosus]|uniref:DUF4371 domain-containing protein n=1 Tax=Araneus ventricosus TaxID=182803 RepID=A0A4Y2FUW2_ARAVE|nr:hypothetical protein AVEN_126363-1 [Araneus ventricosus]